jgi:DNA-binding IclR family transcriptional regulator
LTFLCPHCGKEIVNAVDVKILEALKVAPEGLPWNTLLGQTGLSKGALSNHLKSLIKTGKIKVTLDNKLTRIYKVT